MSEELATYSVTTDEGGAAGKGHQVECLLCGWLCGNNPTRPVAEEQFRRHYQREHVRPAAPSDVIRCDELPDPPFAWKGEHGIGSLLMTDPSLPRDENGAPFQPCFWFDEDGPIVLVRDEAGAALGWGFADGSDPGAWMLRHLPPAIVTAAEEAERSWRSAAG